MDGHLTDANGLDNLLKQAVKVVVQYDKASASLIQRRLDVGYARAARLMDQLEQAGVIGPADGSKPREVLISSTDDFTKNKDKYESKSKYLKVLQNKPINEETIKTYPLPLAVTLSKEPYPPWEPQLPDILQSDEYKNIIKSNDFIVGVEEKEKLVGLSFRQVPNLLVIGNPISNKQLFLDTVLVQLLLKELPASLRLILIDSTGYLSIYNGLPHLLSPVITDWDKSISALRWTVSEIDRRLKIFIRAGVRTIESYNKMAGFAALPKILLIFYFSFDMQEEDTFKRITEIGASCGINTITVLNRAGNSDIPASIKANIPHRLVFRVTSPQDSKLAGVRGAKALEVGEAIYQGGENPEELKIKTIYTPETNVNDVTKAIKEAE